MNKQSITTIIFKVHKEKISVFYPILQQGFKVHADVGKSLKSMLCDQFDLSPEYLSNRIKTIFLNGKPVDNVESAVIFDGAVLALSAAMPGLVGATFRSGGPLSVFRSSISHVNKEENCDISGKGTITLKFFNLLVAEMGPAFLERGILVKAGIIKNLIKEKKADLYNFFKLIIFNGQEISANEINSLKWNDSSELVHVRVQIEK